MHTGVEVPLVRADAPFKDVLVEMTQKRFGATGVLDAEGCLVGVFTDGDLRRQVERHMDLMKAMASDVMTRNPKTIASSELAVAAVARMEDHRITSLFIVDSDGRPEGILHLHDILRSGAV
jgi:arabinose-5-phosphate isomerase